MVGVVRIASYICLCYQQRYGKEIDEMKLQKLLYFTRRESIILETICLKIVLKYGNIALSWFLYVRNIEVMHCMKSCRLK